MKLEEFRDLALNRLNDTEFIDACAIDSYIDGETDLILALDNKPGYYVKLIAIDCGGREFILYSKQKLLESAIDNCEEQYYDGEFDGLYVDTDTTMDDSNRVDEVFDDFTDFFDWYSDKIIRERHIL